MSKRDPEKCFEELWRTFRDRYPFFELRNVDWKRQHDEFRPKVTRTSSDAELFDILCRMLEPLNDGHVEIEARIDGKKRQFTAERPTRFHREFPGGAVKELFKTTADTLAAHGFGRPKATEAWMLHYCRSDTVGYMRILELEGIKKPKLAAALDKIGEDFQSLQGFVIDIRDNPGGDDSTAIQIIDRFTDERRVAFHRRTKLGPGDDDWSQLKTWHLEPHEGPRFTGPIALLTCDAVFSGGEAFALAIRELPYVTIIGEPTNGIFSYTLERTLPNGWEYCLSYQKYFSADMVCYEGKGVPVDVELRNTRADIESGVDPLVVRALEAVKAGASIA